MLIIITFCGQFVRKLQNESFTKEYKLLVMQDIVQEFALPFTIKAIEQKISGVPQNKKVLYCSELTELYHHTFDF
jgi:hypothetical protein